MNESGLTEEGMKAMQCASHIVSMIPPISDFDKDPVLELHKNDLFSSKYCTSHLQSQGDIVGEDIKPKVMRSDAVYDGVNDDIYEDDINGYEERVMQNRIDENIDDNVPSSSGHNSENNYIQDTEVKYNVPDALWVGYVSTTGVYGDHDGGWVTEQSPLLAPPTSKAFHRITAENN